MASVYILYSKNLNRFYIVSCNNLSQRLAQYVNKDFEDSFTAKADDWTLFFSVTDLNYQQARSIETHIKKMKSVPYTENLKKYPDIITKLRETYK